MVCLAKFGLSDGIIPLMNKLFTVLLGFHDHIVGIGQYEASSPLGALSDFIEKSESLDGYDRELLIKSIMPLTHIANMKGFWIFGFNPSLEFAGKNDNPVLGGHIIQTDSKAPTRDN